ncbi:MAG: type I DNA topoisomerase [Candidatus Absconditabacteria bacterium]
MVTKTTKATKKSTTTNEKKQTSGGKSTGKQLVIVESPAKSKTIKKFLGSNFDIQASMGHVVDLPGKELGVDVMNHFKPNYVVSPDKKKVVSGLKRIVKDYSKVWLATDEDREGEAIAWHIATQLNLDLNETNRIAFHEITKSAVENSLKTPRKLDMNLINAQQGRRVLDRLVGFKVSPVLWKKINKGLSAGRVQSVAVKLIVEREREIQNFLPEEKWKVKALLNFNNIDFYVELDKISGKKINLANEDKVNKFLSKLGLTKGDFEIKSDAKSGWAKWISKKSYDYTLYNVDKKKTLKKPQAPFITSTLQQAASSRLGRGVKEVMSVAQKLYEAGFITYMRTDSVNLSGLAIGACKDFIIKNYGENYSEVRNFKSKSKNAQEAHEAIRPTDIFKTPQSLGLAGTEAKLYELIWNRTIASQMSDAIFDTTIYHFDIVVDGKGLESCWLAKGEVLVFDGFMKVYATKNKQEEDESQQLPIIQEGEIVKSKEINLNQTFSKPPARYTEASLVKKLEAEGIGRPSTYAPVISTIQQRGYVVKQEDKKLHPTDIAFVVVDYLVEYFEKLMDYKFTAKMEEQLDNVAEGKEDWTEMMDHFYEDLCEDIGKAENGSKISVPVGKKCPECGSELIYKYAKQGKFVACGNFPDCKYTENTQQQQDILAPLKAKYEGLPCEAGGTIVVRIGRFGPFLCSSEYPAVKRIKSIPNEKILALEEKYGGEKCDKCGEGTMHVKGSRRGPFLACDRYPDCKNAKNIKYEKGDGEEKKD